MADFLYYIVLYFLWGGLFGVLALSSKKNKNEEDKVWSFIFFWPIYLCLFILKGFVKAVNYLIQTLSDF